MSSSTRTARHDRPSFGCAANTSPQYTITHMSTRERIARSALWPLRGHSARLRGSPRCATPRCATTHRVEPSQPVVCPVPNKCAFIGEGQRRHAPCADLFPERPALRVAVAGTDAGVIELSEECAQPRIDRLSRQRTGRRAPVNRPPRQQRAGEGGERREPCEPIAHRQRRGWPDLGVPFAVPPPHFARTADAVSERTAAAAHRPGAQALCGWLVHVCAGEQHIVGEAELMQQQQIGEARCVKLVGQRLLRRRLRLSIQQRIDSEHRCKYVAAAADAN